MEITTVKQGIKISLALDTYLRTWIEAFLFDCKALNLAKGTPIFYKDIWISLPNFVKPC
jgi:hypothetical protein